MWGATERQFNEKIRAETVLGLLYRVKAFYKAISNFGRAFYLIIQHHSLRYLQNCVQIILDYISKIAGIPFLKTKFLKLT